MRTNVAIDAAFVYGSVARGEEVAESDIDLTIVGNTSRFELTKPVRRAERLLARPVNPTIYKPAEFAKKVASDDHFVSAVLDKEKLFVVGDEHDLERARKAETSPGNRPPGGKSLSCSLSPNET